jgi:predicted short-subunit dehydrogenase-like oxidoreductase (DUF2520 family)
MRELERTAAAETTVPAPLEVASIALVGRGRVGRTLAGALGAAGYRVSTLGRDERPADAEAILLCVPDAEIGAAARAVAGAAPYVGHTSGATPLSALEPAGGEAFFGLHPLQTIPAGGADLRGCGAAVAGATDGALELARSIAARLGMVPFELRDDQRAAYHAAASIASNFLVTLEWAAQSVAGVDAPFGPLVRTAVENWIAAGPHAALTGPIARGDEATVAAQREAVAATAPEFLAMFDALAERTRALAAEAARA